MKVNAISCSTDKEIFQDELAICRRERSLANRAMYQSTRQVGVSFYAHDLVGRPAAGANKLSRMVLSHCPTPSSDPTEPVEKIHPSNGVSTEPAGAVSASHGHGWPGAGGPSSVGTRLDC
jgi:hypothetical protein